MNIQLFSELLHTRAGRERPVDWTLLHVSKGNLIFPEAGFPNDAILEWGRGREHHRRGTLFLDPSLLQEL